MTGYNDSFLRPFPDPATLIGTSRLKEKGKCLLLSHFFPGCSMDLSLMGVASSHTVVTGFCASCNVSSLMTCWLQFPRRGHVGLPSLRAYLTWLSGSVYWFARAAVTKYYRPRGSNNRNVLSHSSGG